jgi:hypothetical protein
MKDLRQEGKPVALERQARWSQPSSLRDERRRIDVVSKNSVLRELRDARDSQTCVRPPRGERENWLEANLKK